MATPAAPSRPLVRTQNCMARPALPAVRLHGRLATHTDSSILRHSSSGKYNAQRLDCEFQSCGSADKCCGPAGSSCQLLPHTRSQGQLEPNQVQCHRRGMYIALGPRARGRRSESPYNTVPALYRCPPYLAASSLVISPHLTSSHLISRTQPIENRRLPRSQTPPSRRTKRRPRPMPSWTLADTSSLSRRVAGTP